MKNPCVVFDLWLHDGESVTPTQTSEFLHFVVDFKFSAKDALHSIQAEKFILQSNSEYFFLISLNAWQASCAHIYFHPNKLRFFWQQRQQQQKKKTEWIKRTSPAFTFFCCFVLAVVALAVPSPLCRIWFCPKHSFARIGRRSKSKLGSECKNRVHTHKKKKKRIRCHRHWIRSNLLMDFSQVAFDSVLCASLTT